MIKQLMVMTTVITIIFIMKEVIMKNKSMNSKYSKTKIALLQTYWVIKTIRILAIMITIIVMILFHIHTILFMNMIYYVIYIYIYI